MNKKSNVYQPLLLRILHNLQGISVILAMISAFWTYNTYDGRWGKVNWLPDWERIEGIHGTFGLWVLLLFPIFIIYVFHRGYVKLVQPDSWQILQQQLITNTTNLKSFVSIEWQNISYQGKFLEVLLILIIISSWLISFTK
ncbi:MAG: hypothetical protein IGQ45_05415 [Cyanobacterium sp. T60_A2020_053]|nr:hypothetical protein [Cyanobacterium sp. T60_A2020_053]